MKNAVKKAAATTAGVGKSLAFYAKNTVHKPKEGTADYTRYYSMQAKMHNTMADAFDTGAKVATGVSIACFATAAVIGAVVAAPAVLAASQGAGAYLVAHGAGAIVGAGATAGGTAAVAELTDGDNDEARILEQTARMRDIVGESAGQYQSGDIGLSASQVDAVVANPASESMHVGNVIDSATKRAISADPALSNLQVTKLFERGPDVYDPVSRFWWDVTTPGQWQAHVDKYAEEFGTGIPLFWK